MCSTVCETAARAQVKSSPARAPVGNDPRNRYGLARPDVPTSNDRTPAPGRPEPRKAGTGVQVRKKRGRAVGPWGIDRRPARPVRLLLLGWRNHRRPGGRTPDGVLALVRRRRRRRRRELRDGVLTIPAAGLAGHTCHLLSGRI